uniref:Disease resistance protein RPP13 n=1 Tax=Aegilops tauschii TaxID=37682 RepID=M8BQQ5_AEGTA
MEAAMIPLIKKLGGLLADEYNLEKRVRKRVESLITELEMMHAVLRKISAKPAELFDEEDAVDAFIVRVEDVGHNRGSNNMKNRVKKFLKRATKLFTKGKALHQFSNDIEEAQRLSKELGELRQKYMSDADTKGNADAIDPRLKAVYKDVTELVGIDHRSKDQLRTMSIVGFGGLGKTTLAKAVYDKIKVQFDNVAFVSVSRNPDMAKILKKVLYELDKSKYATINEAARDNEQLIDELRMFLQDKRYLIVIDDIWDEKAWELIKCAFTDNCLGSRVMTTTRIAGISNVCCSSSDDIVYQMKPLPDDDSRKLFYKRIFPQGIKCPDELEEVSRKILKKYGEVPLAIITIASILASDGPDKQIKPKYHWDNILGSIGRGLEEGDSAKDMQRILSYSYYDLPSHLKACLLYLSIFSEDFELRRDRLIWMWIAEGFVQGGKKETGLFELGESYFNELANRNLIQPIDVDATADSALPVGIGKLTSLEELKGLLVDVKELGKLVELRVLYLYWNGSDESMYNSLVVSLGKLRKMQSLTIFDVGDARSDVSWDGWMPTPQLRYLWFKRCTTTLPRWVNSLSFPLLSSMHVSVDIVRPEVDIQILGKLPALHFFWLWVNKSQHTRAETFAIGPNAFPCLREYQFYGFIMGPSIFPRGAMPRLEVLVFSAQASDIVGGDLDVGMEHLPSL